MTQFNPGRMRKFTIWVMMRFRFHSWVFHSDENVSIGGGFAPELIGPSRDKETMNTSSQWKIKNNPFFPRGWKQCDNSRCETMRDYACSTPRDLKLYRIVGNVV